jgi:hypothetical protein
LDLFCREFLVVIAFNHTGEEIVLGEISGRLADHDVLFRQFKVHGKVFQKNERQS